MKVYVVSNGYSNYGERDYSVSKVFKSLESAIKYKDVLIKEILSVEDCWEENALNDIKEAKKRDIPCDYALIDTEREWYLYKRYEDCVSYINIEEFNLED